MVTYLAKSKGDGGWYLLEEAEMAEPARRFLKETPFFSVLQPQKPLVLQSLKYKGQVAGSDKAKGHCPQSGCWWYVDRGPCLSPPHVRPEPSYDCYPPLLPASAKTTKQKSVMLCGNQWGQLDGKSHYFILSDYKWILKIGSTFQENFFQKFSQKKLKWTRKKEENQCF